MAGNQDRWTRTRLPPNGRRRSIPRIPAAAAEEAAANELSESMALQWAAMVEDGGREFGNKNSRRAGAVAGRNRQSARLHRRRRQSRRQFRHSRHHRFGDGVLRASADARNRVRPPGAADDHEPAQFHLRQRRSLARPHHLGALRRLHEFDSAAGRAQRVQGRGVGKFRPRDRRFQPDLFDHRRAARRPPRPDLAAHRGPALHHDRDQPGQAAGRGRAGRRRAGVPAAVAGDVLDRPAGNQSALRRDHRGPPTPRSWCGCASTWKTAAATSNCCCLTRPSSRSARCCCRCSWAKSSAAIRSGKGISRPKWRRPRSPSMPCCTRPTFRSSS